MIRVDGIHKSFGEVRAVRGVSFDAPDGKITGLLGPNGAGKSTTLRILYTVLKPDQGSASIDGADVVAESLEARKRIGALPHGAGLYPHLTAPCGNAPIRLRASRLSVTTSASSIEAEPWSGLSTV